MLIPTLETLLAAAGRIDGSILKTPLHRVPLESITRAHGGGQLRIKMENLQITGSFKARGALNAVLCENATAVVTHSAGNHGAALAWAAQTRGAKCTVVVPDTAPRVKVEAIRELGATVVETEHAKRADTVATIARETGATVIHPFDDDNVIAGQATLGLEILGQAENDLDALLVPISGGGMAAGIASAAAHLNPSLKIVLVEPAGKGLAHALRSNDRGHDSPGAKDPLDTIADGMRSKPLGERPWRILQQCVHPDAVLSVSDDAILDAMVILFRHFKTVVEPSGATALAAILSSHPDDFRRAVGHDAANIGLVVCGGNLDIDPMLRSVLMPPTKL